MARYLFSSHDGFGLGHVRRNSLIARALLDREPDAEIVIVTGLPMRPAWLGDARLHVVPVPALLKDSAGAYRHTELSFEAAVSARAAAFDRTVAAFRPDVVVVDRHPYGVAGELRTGLDRASEHGAALVLGLRDVLDERSTVQEELAGDGWSGVAQRFQAVLVYGDRVLCDHEQEYGLPVAPRYTGWVTDRVADHPRDPRLLVVTAGGGGDGEAVFRLGARLCSLRPQLRVALVAGPYAVHDVLDELAADTSTGGRLRVVRDAPGCTELFARASAVVQMAGYNSTVESLAAGIRPVLVPRRSPRREQAIRASRLSALGLADTVDEQAPAEEVSWLLDRSRLLPARAVAGSGLRLDGAARSAAAIRALVAAPTREALRP